MRRSVAGERRRVAPGQRQLEVQFSKTVGCGDVGECAPAERGRHDCGQRFG